MRGAELRIWLSETEKGAWAKDFDPTLTNFDWQPTDCSTAAADWGRRLIVNFDHNTATTAATAADSTVSSSHNLGCCNHIAA